MRKCLLYILMLLAGIVNAEPHYTRHYTNRYYSTRDGLAQMQVMCAFQDSDGFMWFGTKGGVSRYDGITFKNYTPEHGIPFGETVNISEWGLRKLIFTQRKMTILFPNDSVAVQTLPDKYLYGGRDCRTIELDNNRIMLLGLHNESDMWTNRSNSHHYIYDLKKHKFITLVGFNESVIKVVENKVVTRTGVFEWNGERFKRKIYFPYDVEIAEFNKDFTKCTLTPFNQTFSQLYSIQSGTLKLLTNKIFNDTKAGAWLADDSFLFLNNEGHGFYPQRFSSLKNNLTYPNFIFTDKENNLWIGTENGLYNYFNLNIEEVNLNIGDPDNIWSIVEDENGTMWFGSYGKGLWTVDKSNKLEHIDFTKMLKNRYRNASKLMYMGSTIGNDNNTYITSSDGVSQFKAGKFIQNSNTPAALYAYFDSTTNKILYAGADTTINKRGLFVGMGQNKKFYLFDKGFPVCITKDGKGRIRVGGFRGQGIFTGDCIITDTLKRDYIGVVCMACDKQGRLWKGTEKGIYVELANGKEYRLAPKQLIGSFTSLTVFQNKYLIVAGINSFSIIDIRNLNNYNDAVIASITYEAGFTGLEAGQNGICVSKDAYVWLSTALNVLRFQPDQIMKNYSLKIPEIRLSDISYSTNNINWKTHSFYTGNIKIEANNKFFKIDYIANSISAPKALRFKYRLIGLSDKWSDPVYTKSVNYTNIGFGKYRFELQCSLDGLHWSKTIQSPEIEITVPFYLRPISFLIYLLIIIGLSIYLTKLYIKRKQVKQLQEIQQKKLENELQLKTLRSKIIPHFTKNVLSAIGHFAMTDKLKAGHYIAVFSKFTQLTLSSADKNYITLEDEINYLHTYLELEKMRFGDKFDYKIELSKSINMQILIPSMILHTYCDNAIRHGLVNKQGFGLLEIIIDMRNDGLYIQVKDNGIGREKAKQLGTSGNGQGLMLVQSQIEFYNQKNSEHIKQTIIDLKNAKSDACGTIIELFVPDNYNY